MTGSMDWAGSQKECSDAACYSFLRFFEIPRIAVWIRVSKYCYAHSRGDLFAGMY